MNKTHFNELKSMFLETAKKSIEEDGYASMSHVFKSVIEEVNSQQHRNVINDNDVSQFSSISALLIKSGENIREPIFNKENALINYHVLKNPNHELNESFKQTNDSVRTINKTQRKLLYLTAFLSLCALLVNIFKSDTNVINPAPVYILQKPEQTTKDTQLKTPSHTQKDSIETVHAPLPRHL